MGNIVTAFHESTASSFVNAMSQTLSHLDENGRLTSENARALRRAIAEARNERRLGGVVELDKYFGPFESLPLGVKHAIVRAITDDDRWRMAGHELGDWHFEIIQILQTLYWKLVQYKLDHLISFIHLLADIVHRGPRWMLHAMYRRQLSWQGKYYTRPTLKAVLNIAGIEPWNFAVCYARDIPQPMAYRGFWHDPPHHNTVGVVLGIDLIPTPEGYWYVESNLNCGLRFERTALYSCDPFVLNLLEFTKAQGYRHLVVMAGNLQRVDKLMAKQYEEGALARGIKLSIIEDAYLPNSKYAQSFGIPTFYNDSTLVVRIKFYPTNLDYLFNHKWASMRALEIYKQHSSDPALLLPTTSTEPVLGEVDSQDPFPNLVYKFPEMDCGESVIFLKVTSPEHARKILEEAICLNRRRRPWNRYLALIKEQKGLYQSYIQSSLSPDRQLYIVRAHVLITPIGIKFLSAHHVVSGRRVPEHLPLGVVHEPLAFIVNHSVGSKLEIVPPKEEPAVKTAALAVARGLAWAATYGFQTVTA